MPDAVIASCPYKGARREASSTSLIPLAVKEMGAWDPCEARLVMDFAHFCSSQ